MVIDQTVFSTSPLAATVLQISGLKGDKLKWSANSGTIDLTKLRYRYIFLNPDAQRHVGPTTSTVLTNDDGSSSLGEILPRYEILSGDNFQYRFFVKGMINVDPEAARAKKGDAIQSHKFAAFGYNMFDFLVEFRDRLNSIQIEEQKAEIIKAWTEILSGGAVARAFDDLFERVYSNDDYLEILAIKESNADAGTRMKEALGAAFHRKFPNSYPCKQNNPRSERAIKNAGRTAIILKQNLFAALSIVLPPLEGDVAAQILSLFQRAPVYSEADHLPETGMPVTLPSGEVSFDLFGSPIRYILYETLQHVLPNLLEQDPMTPGALRPTADLMVVEIDEDATSALLGGGASGGPGNFFGAGAVTNQQLGQLQANTIDSFKLQGFKHKTHLNGIYTATPAFKVNNQPTFWHENEQFFIVSWNNGWHVAAWGHFNKLSELRGNLKDVESKFEAHLSSCGDTQGVVWWNPAGCEWVERFGPRLENPVRVTASPLTPFQVTKIFVNKTAYDSRVKTEHHAGSFISHEAAQKFVGDLLAQLLNQAVLGNRFFIDLQTQEEAVLSAKSFSHQLRFAAGLVPQTQFSPAMMHLYQLRPAQTGGEVVENLQEQQHVGEHDDRWNEDLMEQACQRGQEVVMEQQGQQVMMEGMSSTEVGANVAEPDVIPVPDTWAAEDESGAVFHDDTVVEQPHDHHAASMLSEKAKAPVDISKLLPGCRFVGEAGEEDWCEDEEAVTDPAFWAMNWFGEAVLGWKPSAGKKGAGPRRDFSGSKKSVGRTCRDEEYPPQTGRKEVRLAGALSGQEMVRPARRDIVRENGSTGRVPPMCRPPIVDGGRFQKQRSHSAHCPRSLPTANKILATARKDQSSGDEPSDSSNERSSDRSSGKTFRGTSDPRGTSAPRLTVLKDDYTERKVFCEAGSQAVSKLREDATAAGLGDRLLPDPTQKATLQQQMDAFLGDRFLSFYNALVAVRFGASAWEAHQLQRKLFSREHLGGGSRENTEKKEREVGELLREMAGSGEWGWDAGMGQFLDAVVGKVEMPYLGVVKAFGTVEEVVQKCYVDREEA